MRPAAAWAAFTMADTPGYRTPTAPCSSTLRTPLAPLANHPANEWHSALMKYRISSDYSTTGRPNGRSVSSSSHARSGARRLVQNISRMLNSRLTFRVSRRGKDPHSTILTRWRKCHHQLYRRLGWMTRAPAHSRRQRLIVPLYSDGFSFSLIKPSPTIGENVAHEHAAGRRWQHSTASSAATTARHLDAGQWPPPKRLHQANPGSGRDLEPGGDSNLPNLGSGKWIISSNGHWASSQRHRAGRNSLAVQISDDEERPEMEEAFGV